MVRDTQEAAVAAYVDPATGATFPLAGRAGGPMPVVR